MEKENIVITVRNLRKSDAKRVALLIPQLTKNIVDRENLVEWLERLAAPRHWQYLVAEQDGLVIAFGGMAWIPVPSKKWRAYVEEVVTDESYRRQGAARKIMSILVALAKDKKISEMRLMVKNINAKSLYKSLGFIKRDEDSMVLKLH